MSQHYSRRRFLAATGTVSAVAVAGCSSGSGNSDDTTIESGGDGSNGDGSNGGNGSGDWTQTSTVDMNDELAFVPDRIEVSAGTTVTWENVGAVAHSVTAYEDEIPDDAEYFASGGFNSQQAASDAYPDEGSIPEGETYEHTFETTGTYEYYCIPHEMSGMVGTVRVV